MPPEIPLKPVSAIRDPGTRDLATAEGETVVLSSRNEYYASLFVRVRIESLRDAKEIIGVPDGLHATSGRRAVDLSSSLVEAASASRRQGPKALNTFVNTAAKEFIFRDSEVVAPFVPSIEARLVGRIAVVVLIQDLVLRRNSTLVIPREVSRLTVRNVTIEPGARLVIRGGNMLIRARSLRGEISTAIVPVDVLAQ